MAKKLLVPVLAATILAVVPASAMAVPHWFKNLTELGSTPLAVPTAGNLSFNALGTEVKCKVNDVEEVWNPVGGGPGVDLMTAFTMSKCKVLIGSAACPAKSMVELLSNGLSWPSRLLEGPPIRDEILKMRIIYRCLAGTAPDEFEGSLAPEVVGNELVFGPGSGTLTDPSLNPMTITGGDKLAKKITAK